MTRTETNHVSGEHGHALERLTADLPRLRRAGDQVQVGWTVLRMARAHVHLSEWDAAEECFREAADTAENALDQRLEGAVAAGLGEMHMRRRDLGAAGGELDRAVALLSPYGGEDLAEALKLVGILAQRRADPRGALASLQEALTVAEAAGRRIVQAEIQSELAVSFLAEGRNADALSALNAARAGFLELRMSPEVRELERRLNNLEGVYFQVVKAWSESIESKDHYTAGHCERVARYACSLAESLGLRGGDLEWLRLGAFVHDVGKTAVPPEVLNKPGKLDESEWELMKSHTVVGDRMIEELRFPWDLRPIVRNHHERWDGTGYPDGLAGEEIPLTARIMAVADVYDALTTTRSYRPALSMREALGIMERESGRVFDPCLLKVFMDTVVPTHG